MRGMILVSEGRLARFKVPVALFREGGQYVADCVMLGLASHGKSKKEARSSLENIIEVFLEEVIEMCTLERVLAGRGWKKQGPPAGAPPRTVRWVPPRVITATLAHASV